MRHFSVLMGAMLFGLFAAGCGELGGGTYSEARSVDAGEHVLWSQGQYPDFHCSDDYDSLNLTREDPKGKWRDIEVTLKTRNGYVDVEYGTINMTAAGYIVQVEPEVGLGVDWKQRFVANGTSSEAVVWDKPAIFRSITLCFRR